MSAPESASTPSRITHHKAATLRVWVDLHCQHVCVCVCVCVLPLLVSTGVSVCPCKHRLHENVMGTWLTAPVPDQGPTGGSTDARCGAAWRTVCSVHFGGRCGTSACTPDISDCVCLHMKIILDQFSTLNAYHAQAPISSRVLPPVPSLVSHTIPARYA